MHPSPNEFSPLTPHAWDQTTLHYLNQITLHVSPAYACRNVGGFELGNCIPLQIDKLWAQVPYNLSALTIVSIQNVVLGSCDDNHTPITLSSHV